MQIMVHYCYHLLMLHIQIENDRLEGTDRRRLRSLKTRRGADAIVVVILIATHNILSTGESNTQRKNIRQSKDPYYQRKEHKQLRTEFI